MSLFIPAIEWNEKSLIGDVETGLSTILNTTDTTKINEGDTVVSNAFPYNTTVISKTSNSLTLSSDSLETTSSKNLTFYNRFDFTYPPTIDNEESAKVNKDIAESEIGLRQTVFHYIELTRSIEFWFLTKEQKDILRNEIYFNFLAQGKKIRYFEDKEINSFVKYEDDASSFSQERQVKKHPKFLYKVEFNFRRVSNIGINETAPLNNSIIIGS